MSMKKCCPRADISKYEINSVFYGSIVSTYSKFNGLVYCVDTEYIENFSKIDDYKNYEKMSKKPKLGAFFVYFSYTRQSYYRAYNLGANPAEPLTFKVFFLDTGEVYYMMFKYGKFFYLPEALYMPVLGIFCKFNSIPKKFKSTLDFFNLWTFKKLKFKIIGKGRAENALGTNEECLIVDVELYKKPSDLDDDDDEQEETEESKTLKLTRLALKKFTSSHQPQIELTYNDGPFMSSEIPQKTLSFEPGQKVLIFPQKIITSNTYYGACKDIHDALGDFGELTRLMIHMNRFTIKYEKMDVKPILNEMVVMREEFEDCDRYYRGMVLDIFDEICVILYVDYGKTQPFHYTKLFKFPIEFSTIPFHIFRIHASNIQISNDEAINHKNFTIVDLTIKPMCFGIVEKFSEFDIVVKLYNNLGHNMKNVLENIHKPLYVPKVLK